MDNLENIDTRNIFCMEEFIDAIENARKKSIKTEQHIKSPKFKLKPYWNDELRRLQRHKKEAVVAYFRSMTPNNWVNYEILAVKFKRRLKECRRESWVKWAEGLSPRTPIKEI